MSKSNERLSTLKEERRIDIITAALKVFCNKGYDATTINDIVKKAKCSHGLFYHYFENKKAIFNAVMESRGKNIMDFLDEVLESDDDYVQKLKKLTTYTFENMKNDEVFAYRYYFFVSSVFASFLFASLTMLFWMAAVVFRVVSNAFLPVIRIIAPVFCFFI